MILFVNLEETILKEDPEAALAMDTTPPPLIVKGKWMNPRLRAKLRRMPSATRPMPGVFAAPKYVVYIEWEFSRKVAPA
jgi:hypothetical protein